MCHCGLGVLEIEFNGGIGLPICRYPVVMVVIVISVVYVLHFYRNASFAIHYVLNCSHGDCFVDVLVCVV